MLFFFKQKTAYEMRISDWSSDVCSSDLAAGWSAEAGTRLRLARQRGRRRRRRRSAPGLRPGSSTRSWSCMKQPSGTFSDQVGCPYLRREARSHRFGGARMRLISFESIRGAFIGRVPDRELSVVTVIYRNGKDRKSTR